MKRSLVDTVFISLILLLAMSELLFGDAQEGMILTLFAYVFVLGAKVDSTGWKVEILNLTLDCQQVFCEYL